MSFLSSIYLWLIPLASLPVLIHLFFNKKFKVIEFSSIKFLNKIEVDSIRKIKIIEIILLIIRTLIILFIILMISKPVITNKSYSSLINNSSQIYCVIAIDDSFSMLNEDTELKLSDVYGKKVVKIADSLPGNTRLKIFTLSNKSLLYDGLVSDIDISKLSSKISFGEIDLLSFLNTLKNNYTYNKELHIVTDMQKYPFNNLDQILGDWMIFIHDFSDRVDNLSLIKVTILNDIISINEEISIEVLVENTGTKTANSALLVLNVDNINVGQKEIDLSPGQKKTILFKTIIDTPGNHKCHAEIIYDKILSDNYYYFNINYPDDIKVLLLSEDIDNHKYVETSFNAINSQIKNINLFNTTAALSDYNVITNSDITMVFGYKFLSNNNLFDYINEQLYNGGHVYIFPDDNDYINNIEETLFDYYTINPKTILYDEKTSESSVQINNSNILSERIINLFKSNDNYNMFSIYKYFSFPIEDNAVMQIDSRSIWNKISVSNGELNLMGFTPTLEWTDFPLRASFIKFINYAANLSSNNTYNIVSVGDSYLIEDDFYTIYTPNSKPYIHNYGSNNEFIYSLPGRYQIISNDKVKEISVNPPENELDFSFISEHELNSIFKNVLVIYNNIDNQQTLKTARLGTELWKYFLYLIIIFVILEMVISNQFYRRK